jgi:GntR family transcriptional regulator/MocR family aminotransferase
MQFFIPLDRKLKLYPQVFDGLRQAILSGTFTGEHRLPSSRELAEHLAVSRSVVIEAFEQLHAEGLVVGRRGSGTYAIEGLSSARSVRTSRSAKPRLSRFGVAAEKVTPTLSAAPRTSRLRYDFQFGQSESDIENFPFAFWQRTLARRARKTSLADLDYGPAAGNLALREAICAHLTRTRRVNCDASQVLIVNGSQQALDLIVRVLLERGDRVCLEDPSYHGTRKILLASGACLSGIPVDQEGLDSRQLPGNARLCFVTPSHQFPTGAVLSFARRRALLDWAKRANSIIVEDDYDGEFRYGGQPLESLQGLDEDGRVVYVGTFSRTIYPALRVGYMIVPKPLVDAFTGAKWINDQQSATLEQRTLAEFLASGAYERHLRRVRRRNGARRDALLQAIEENLDGLVEVTGAGAGAHVALWPTRRISEKALVLSAASHEVGVYGMSRYFLAKASRPAVLLGYSRLNEAEIREGIRRLRLSF